MTRRNRTQEEYAAFEEQTYTNIQMIVSAIEASNKELIRTIKEENKETRATIRKENRETRNFTKNCRGISRNASGNGKERSLRKPNT